MRPIYMEESVERSIANATSRAVRSVLSPRLLLGKAQGREEPDTASSRSNWVLHEEEGQIGRLFDFPVAFAEERQRATLSSLRGA